ncbi:MAG: hypothetical protein ABSH47_12390 [Bryobacteraceae bacterium]|jgi:hypothetical protein
MLKISRSDKRLARLATPSFSDASILECADLQTYIMNSPEAFFAEIDEKLFVLGKEIRPSDTVQDRIDILAADADGQMVIIELKRGSHKLQLLQAIAYAGMIAHWDAERVRKETVNHADALSDFLEVDAELNSAQRIILIAESYDYEVLVTAKWLNSKYGVDIMCARVALAVDPASGTEYLTGSRVFPPRELEENVIIRGPHPPPGETRTWDDVLQQAKNPAVTEFFVAQRNAGRARRPGVLAFNIGDRRRVILWLKHEFATVEQVGRFPDDVNFWRQRLSEPDTVHDIRDGELLRFRIRTPDDVAALNNAINTDLPAVSWQPMSDVAAAGAE